MPNENTRAPAPTLGESRVRVSFNPSGNSLVDDIKQQTAALIDLCEGGRAAALKAGASVEVIRLYALAQTSYEEAAMWAVKAETAGVKYST